MNVKYRIRLLYPLLAVLACSFAYAGPPVSAGTDSAQQLHAPDASEAFDFMIFGDRTGGPPEGIAVLADAVKMANRMDVDLVLTVGDLVEGYNEPEQWLKQMREYQATVADLDMPWYPVPGNHDVYARPKKPGGHMDLYKQHFGPLYYSFDYKWAHFIVLFSDESLSFSDPAKNQNMSDEQMAWLRADLESTDADRVFAFLHHPRWEKRYEGCNWNDVHDIFVADGRPTTIFAGHIHIYRDDGQRDNVHYYALATTGAHLRPFPKVATFHHVDFVRVRRDRIAVAVLPVGSVYASDFVLGEEVETMGELARGSWLAIDGDAAIGLPAGARSSFTIELTNPTDERLHFTLDLSAAEGWTLDYEPVDRTVMPREKVVVEVRATAPALGDTPPEVNVLARAFYKLRSGLIEPVEIRANVPVQLNVSDDLTAADRGNNGVLTLDGSSAVRVDVPDELGKYTLECWARGPKPEGRTALVTKTEGSAYGIFWGEPGSGASTPIGFACTTAGYLELPSKEPWQWDQWTHLALVFDGKTAAFYANGQLQSRESTEAKARHNRHPLYVGADPNGRGDPVSFFTGQIDEVRLSGVARYDGPFAPARVFDRDEDTVLLLHFDRPFGSAALDDSGNGHHGWSVGKPKIERVKR